MKKILALILAMMMLLAFAACDKKSDSDSDEKDSASKLPSAVTDAVKDAFEDDATVGSLKCEYKQSKDGATYYLISGKITDVEDEEDADYKDGYFIGVAYEYDGEAEFMTLEVYEKDEKDDFKDELEEAIEECKDNKDDIDERLESIADED